MYIVNSSLVIPTVRLSRLSELYPIIFNISNTYVNSLSHYHSKQYIHNMHQVRDIQRTVCFKCDDSAPSDNKCNDDAIPPQCLCATRPCASPTPATAPSAAGNRARIGHPRRPDGGGLFEPERFHPALC